MLESLGKIVENRMLHLHRRRAAVFHYGGSGMIFLSPQERSTPPRQGARNLSRAVPCHRSNESQRPASPSRPAPTVHPATTGTDAVYRAVRNESLASDGARALKGCAYRVGMRPATPGGWKVLLRRVGSGGGLSRRDSLVTDRKPLPPPPWMESHLLQLDDDC